MRTKTKPPKAVPAMEILVVEDNAGDAFLLVKFLEHCKVPTHVTVVRDGEEASDLLKKAGSFGGPPKPDLVFLDLNLPRKDGRTILREIKSDPRLMDVPVLVLTTSSWEQDVTQVYDYHANLYLVKPPDLEQFLASMKYVEETWLKTIVPHGG